MRWAAMLPWMCGLALGMGLQDGDREPARGQARLDLYGNLSIQVDYGRPRAGGRDVLALAEEGMLWRLGMNEATELETGFDLIIQGRRIQKGRYTLFARKTGEKSWNLVFHDRTGLWGTGEYDPEHDVAEFPMVSITHPGADEVDPLTIRLDRLGKSAGNLRVLWGQSELALRFRVIRTR